MGRKKTDLPPTKMGDRILTFMQANGFDNHAHFAEQMVGVSRQTFHAWIYKHLNPEKVAAAPILRCAELLSTNAEYLLCITDDFRPEASLSIEMMYMTNPLWFKIVPSVKPRAQPCRLTSSAPSLTRSYRPPRFLWEPSNHWAGCL